MHIFVLILERFKIIDKYIDVINLLYKLNVLKNDIIRCIRILKIKLLTGILKKKDNKFEEIAVIIYS